MPILINGERVQLEHDPGATPRTTTVIEFTGQETAEIRLTELDQTDPAGRFRIRVTGDAMLFERTTKAEWAKAQTVFTIDSSGAKVHSGGVDIDLAELALEVSQIRELLSLFVGYIPPVGDNSRAWP